MLLNSNNYLAIINAALITDMFVIVLLIAGVIKSNVLINWYKTYNLSAVICDVLIIVIGVLIARAVYPYIFGNKTPFSIVKFTGLAVVIQIIHDVIFNGIITAIPRGSNRMVDTFKAYAKEVGIKAILSDSAMMISTCLISNYLVGMDSGVNSVTFIVSLYLLPYLIYTW